MGVPPIQNTHALTHYQPFFEAQSPTLNTEDKEINLHTELSVTFSKNKLD